MKYILGTLLSSVICCNTVIFSQERAFNKINYVTPYIGFFPLDYSTYGGLNAHGFDKFIGLPLALGVRTEFNRTNKVSWKIDLNFAYTGFFFHSDDTLANYGNGIMTYLFGYGFKQTTMRIKGMVAFNYYFKEDEKNQSYFTLGIGYKYKRRMRLIDNLEKKK